MIRLFRHAINATGPALNGWCTIAIDDPCIDIESIRCHCWAKETFFQYTFHNGVCYHTPLSLSTEEYLSLYFLLPAIDETNNSTDVGQFVVIIAIGRVDWYDPGNRSTGACATSYDAVNATLHVS